MASAGGAAPHHDMLARIYGQPQTLTPLLRALLTHARASYGDALSARNVDLVALMIEQNHPAWNVALATIFVDLLESVRRHVVDVGGPARAAWTRLFLDYVREKCLQLRTESFSAENMHGILLNFATDVSNAYQMRNRALVEHVVRAAQGETSIDAAGHASAVSVDTLSAVQRARAQARLNNSGGGGGGGGDDAMRA